MKNIVTLFLALATLPCFAQNYITAGSIEYEVKANVHAQNEGNEWFDRFKDQIPKFNVNYYKLMFNNNISVYKFDRRGDARRGSWGLSDEENLWYNDFNNHTFVNMMTLEGYLLFDGTQRKIEWKMSPNEQREIAGFNCRLARAILFDSVYVFAYYTDEIAISGGPMNLNGLPGAILGVTVPRLHTSWIATGVTLDPPPAKELVPPTKGKKKTQEEVKTDLASLTKSWGNDSRKWIEQLYWRSFL
ncbi:GLPGLI family protein [Niabella insulamsoli]|uniref:GLPGLI family protein n=1 Tax=Niabella insulamsoli TaxID=3144874 RepID=UPI0031FD603B